MNKYFYMGLVVMSVANWGCVSREMHVLREISKKRIDKFTVCVENKCDKKSAICVNFEQCAWSNGSRAAIWTNVWIPWGQSEVFEDIPIFYRCIKVFWTSKEKGEFGYETICPRDGKYYWVIVRGRQRGSEY